MTFSERLEKLIIEIEPPKAGSKARFAQRLEISPQKVSSWLKEVTKPTLEQQKSISDTYSVNLQWLMFGEGDMFKTVNHESKHGPVDLSDFAIPIYPPVHFEKPKDLISPIGWIALNRIPYRNEASVPASSLGQGISTLYGDIITIVPTQIDYVKEFSACLCVIDNKLSFYTKIQDRDLYVNLITTNQEVVTVDKTHIQSTFFIHSHIYQKSEDSKDLQFLIFKMLTEIRRAYLIHINENDELNFALLKRELGNGFTSSLESAIEHHRMLSNKLAEVEFILFSNYSPDSSRLIIDLEKQFKYFFNQLEQVLLHLSGELDGTTEVQLVHSLVIISQSIDSIITEIKTSMSEKQ